MGGTYFFNFEKKINQKAHTEFDILCFSFEFFCLFRKFILFKNDFLFLHYKSRNKYALLYIAHSLLTACAT